MQLETDVSTIYRPYTIIMGATNVRQTQLQECYRWEKCIYDNLVIFQLMQDAELTSPMPRPLSKSQPGLGTRLRRAFVDNSWEGCNL